MKKIWIFLYISLLLMFLGFVWCWPFSNSYEEINNIVISIVKNATIIYLVYFIFKILDKKNYLYRLYKKTDKAIIYVPYLFVFFFALLFFFSLIVVFGLKIYGFSSYFLSFFVSLHANDLIQRVFKQYEKIDDH